MAHIFKPVAVKPIPKNAVTRTIDGKRVATWTNRKHRKVTAELTDDGLKCRVSSPTWWIEYTGPTGKERKRGFRDRSATMELASKLERVAEDMRSGRDVPRHEPAAHLIDHLEDFRAALEQKGNGPRHVGYVVANVRAAITGLGLTTPAAVDCDRVTSWLGAECKRQGRAPETFNRSVKHLRQFGRWLVRANRAKHNPFERLATVNAAPHRTRFRRRLTDDELSRLIGAARCSKVAVHALPGPDRARLYLLAAYTGIRRGALAKITPEAFAWDRRGQLPVSVTVSARLAKNRRSHTVPLHPDVAADLASWLMARDPGAPIFPPGRWSQRSSELVTHDLAAARAAWLDEAKSKKERERRERSDTLKRENAAGEVFDFHGFRLQFLSGLAIAGVPLTAAQQLADHSTPNLTANVYSKWGSELAGQVAKLPRLQSGLVPGIGRDVPGRGQKGGKRPVRRGRK